MAIIISYEKNGKTIYVQKGILCDISLLDKPRIWVDFNGPWTDLYFLSQVDIIRDSNGNEIELTENMEISIFDFDSDENNNSDNLLADGIVILNNTGEYPSVKWLVKIIPNNKYGKFYWVSDTKKYTPICILIQYFFMLFKFIWIYYHSSMLSALAFSSAYFIAWSNVKTLPFPASKSAILSFIFCQYSNSFISTSFL